MNSVLSALTDFARMRERILESFVDLCSIEAPSLSEAAVVRRLREMVADLPVSVTEDRAGVELGGDSGNLVVTLPGERAGRIALVAHMDTVPPVVGVPMTPIVEGDRVHTAGKQILGGDDRAGVAIAVELLRLLARVDVAVRPTVIACFTVAEELGLQGARRLDVAALNADYAFVLDGEVSVGEVITRAPFKESLEIEVNGRRAHAALEPEAGVHAIAAAARVVSAFPLGRVADDMVTNIGRIEGGTASNVVPDRTVIQAEIRAFTEPRLNELFDQIAAAAARESAAAGATVTVKRSRLYDGYAVDNNHPAMRALAATAPAHNITLNPVSSIGGSDTNILNGQGLPAVDVGIGMHNIHSVDEWISVADLSRVTLWLADAIIQ